MRFSSSGVKVLVVVARAFARHHTETTESKGEREAEIKSVTWSCSWGGAESILGKSDRRARG